VWPSSTPSFELIGTNDPRSGHSQAGDHLFKEKQMKASDSESQEKIDQEIVREEEKVLTPSERFRIVLEKRLKKKNS
jgi:hypothetical protein